ncbi:hypothetical protein BSKO_03777 [Bryopsis sp. KO-2023]|nr:hypothetical protein BSKO_03777 [Bryopsis sp. KO-2023]
MISLFCLVFGVLLLLHETTGQEAGDVKVVASAIGFDPDNQGPPVCYNSSSPSECVNNRDFIRILASENADACSDAPFTASTTKDVIAESVTRCLNAVRVQPELLRDSRPLSSSLLTSLFHSRAAVTHASFMRDMLALGHEGSNGMDFVGGITSTARKAIEKFSWYVPASLEVMSKLCLQQSDGRLATCLNLNTAPVFQSCAFDTIGAGAANVPGTTEWFVTVQLGCSAFDGDCRCSTVEVVESPPQLPIAAIPLEEGAIQEQSIEVITPDIGEAKIAGDPAGVTSPACIFATTPDCVNPRSLIATQANADIDQACPDVRLYGSGLSLGEVTNQIEECINAYRIAPNAFESLLPCAYTFRDEVTVPQRTPLKVTRQSSDNPIHPLDVSSTAHSRDMANRNYFSHDSQDGRSFSDRILAEGWKGYPIGENIAAGYQTVRATVLGWVCSAGHRRSLMSCGFDIMGTGVAFNPDSKFKYYYTQNFGCGASSGECKCGDTIQAAPPRAAPTRSSPTQRRSTPVRLPPPSPPAGSPTTNIFGQSLNGTLKSEPRVVGDPLVWMNPTREKAPRCFVFPGEECAGDDYVAPELVDPEEVCSSAPFNGTDIDIANDVATSGALLGHIDANGKNVVERLEDQNVTTSLVGELISAGYQSVQEAVLAWVCSPTHRQLLMSCGFDSFGTGVSMDKFSGLQTYVTQTFTCSRPDGECTCAPRGNNDAIETLPSRMMCTVGSSQDDRVGSSVQATSRHSKTRGALPRGIMYTLNAAAIGEGCLPTTIESQLVIAIFLDKEMSQLKREDFEIDMNSALQIHVRPAEGKNGKVWLLTVVVPDSFFGLVEISMAFAEPKQTLRVKRVTEKEMLDHIIRSSSGGRSCP